MVEPTHDVVEVVESKDVGHLGGWFDRAHAETVPTNTSDNYTVIAL